MGFKKKYWVTIIIITISLLVGIVIGTFISGKSFGSKFFLSKENKIDTILGIINEEYVDTVQLISLIENALPHIIDELDPHSSYIPSSQSAHYSEDMEGRFGGIGIEINFYLDTLVIVRVYPGSPAGQAGLQAGDRIVLIEDRDYLAEGLSIDEVTDLLKGKIGTKVLVHVKKYGQAETKPFSLERQSIPMETIVSYRVDENTGLIKIVEKFTHKTHDEFIQSMAKLKSEGCTQFIIDLRENGGGAMDAAINIANELLPAGNMIVYSEGKAFPEQPFFANGTGALRQEPLVILLDQFSASASEILAGAVQDNDRGLIVGRRSYGKGLVQNHIELADGSALRLTVARYYTPSGRNIQRPYELGKAKEYNQKWFDQLVSGESFSKDSIKINEELIFETMGGRTVYGGGGIVPDIFVPLDTTSMTSYYMNLSNQDIFYKFAFYYSDTNRELLGQFKTSDEMLEYLREEPILWEIVSFAEQQGIRRRSNLIYKSSKQILANTHAHILYNFFGNEAFFPVYMSYDPMIETALQALKNGNALPTNIKKETYLDN
ncbi:peptidase S41 [Bacteroidales bacterium OttesenSCG-928-L03]|nr:peptidase S41 [Bacteroidales bacterium OttesenSCG-928-L03]